ncbi:RHS repeat protein, partial [Paraburkholderia agricolaris]
SETYTWTSAGQLASVTDRKGQVTTYRYDAAGRLTRRELTPPGGDRPMRTQNYGWDAVTGKFQITSQSAWKDPYFTDNAAVLMVKRDPVSGKVAGVSVFPNLPGHQTQQFGYAPDSRDLTRVVLNDATVDYMRDAEHRITQAQYTLNDEAPKTFTFAYDALGRRSKATLGNGIAIAYTWDAASQLTGITYGRSDGTTIGTLTYTYDAAGRRTGMGGSLANTTLPQPVADAQYNGANQLTRWAGKTFTYDANGSLTGDGVNRYGWGVTGEFSQIDSADGSSIQYQYDVLGRRKRTIANGSRTTDYLNVGDDLALANTD